MKASGMTVAVKGSELGSVSDSEINRVRMTSKEDSSIHFSVDVVGYLSLEDVRCARELFNQYWNVKERETEHES